MIDWTELSAALCQQKTFSDLFFDSEEISVKEKEDILKTFVLSLHSEVTGIAEGVNYKDHRRQSIPIDKQKILYKTVDAYRYLLAILNLQGINSDEFSKALQQKDDFLHYRNNLKNKSWSGQPVILFDLDDVLSEFRTGYYKFILDETGVLLNAEGHEYYNITELKNAGLDNELLFNKFIDNHGFLNLDVNSKWNDVLVRLKEQGYWIQIITARPALNTTVFYDTYSWLVRHQIPADGVSFSFEKFPWLSSQPFYRTGNFIAIDDSSKHAAEYAKHNVVTVVPQKSYNTEVKLLENVIWTPHETDPFSTILEYIKARSL